MTVPVRVPTLDVVCCRCGKYTLTADSPIGFRATCNSCVSDEALRQADKRAFMRRLGWGVA